jgi:hypothetical protein
VRVAVGDVNGDGVPDIITGPGQSGGSLVKVFDGTNLTLIRAFNAYVDTNGTDFNSGVFVGAADVNGDGHADIITGPGAGGGPLVRVWDGQTNALLLAFNAYDPAFRAGVHVAGGDTDGTGLANIVTGPGEGGGPLVKVFDGRTGALKLAFNAFDIGVSFPNGAFVAVADVNGDGKADVITGPGLGGGPLVSAFDVSTNQANLLVSLNAFPNSPSGLRVAALDINGDGKADLVVVRGQGQPPEVKVFDAVTLSVIDDFFAYDSNYKGGVFIGAG